MASNEAAKKVNPPVAATMTPGSVPFIRGERLIRRYTPAFTIVAECRRAEVGVGATMAPNSHLENGICADLVSAAKASIPGTSRDRAPPKNGGAATGHTLRLPAHRT